MAVTEKLDMMQILGELACLKFSGTRDDEARCKEYLVEKFNALGEGYSSHLR
ncbi:MAG: hypothetical protein Q6373_024325 [Candidatus Sigynarchaeota archaeon]